MVNLKQHPGLTRAGAGGKKEGAIDVFDGLFLLGVGLEVEFVPEVFEIRFHGQSRLKVRQD